MGLPLLTLDEIFKDYEGRRVMASISDNHWSVRDAATQERLFNTDELMLTKVTTFVDERKRQECLKDERRRVKKTHAFVIGFIGEVEDGEYHQIDYDPFVGGYFFYVKDKFPFTRALFAYARDHRFEVSHGEPK
jgi:hypothetical protein